MFIIYKNRIIDIDMATEKQKVLGLDSVEQIKTYVCFACENTKRDVIQLMDKVHEDLMSTMKQHVDNKISSRAALVDSDGNNGDITNYTIKTTNIDELINDKLDENALWELNRAGNGQLSNAHIGWEQNGSGYIGKKVITDYEFEGVPNVSFDNTIYWDENGIISFGKNVKPWAADLNDIYDKLLRIIESYHKGTIEPEEPYIILNNVSTRLDTHKLAPSTHTYITLNNSNTKLNVHKLAPSKPSQYRYIVLDDYSTNVDIDRIK